MQLQQICIVQLLSSCVYSYTYAIVHTAAQLGVYTCSQPQNLGIQLLHSCTVHIACVGVGAINMSNNSQTLYIIT